MPYWKPSEADRPHQTETLELVEKQRVMEEERRLLYVAMTRAEERLYITGWKTQKQGKDKDQDKAASTSQPASWYDPGQGRPSKPPTPRSASNG